MGNNSVPSWFDNFISNGGRACHPYVAGALGINTTSDGFIGLGVTVHKELGFFTGFSTAIQGSFLLEKYHLAMLTASVYCGASYAAGGIDAWYQSGHKQKHIGTAIADQAVEWWEETSGWYEAKEQGVDDFLVGIHEWWKN